mgnify:CR=1 FL=1
MTENSSKKNFLTYDVLVNTLWVSTILALILTLPSVGIFLYVFLETGSWLTGALLAFGIHFVILAFSERIRSEEHTSELQSLVNLVCRLLLEKKK